MQILGIDAILHSGQVFRYFKRDGGYDLVVGSNYAYIKNNIIECNDAEYFKNYFDLDTDYNEIKKELSKDKTIAKILKEPDVGNIRILRAEFVEITISFILSANNNIKRFTKILNNMCEKFGNRLANGLYAFPTLEQLSKITFDDFNALGCGYRSKYLVTTIQQLKNFDVKELSKLDNKELSKRLQTLSGVGPKVADCVMLFCGDFHRLDVVPVDVWISKALNHIQSHKYAGVAQQYIFYYLQYLHKIL